MSGDLRVTWWGHASTTIELGGLRILTDPVLTGRVAFLHRFGSTPPASAADADVVLVSHLHGDHLHLPSLRKLPSSARLIAPRGSTRLLAGVRDQVDEVGPGDRMELGGGIELQAVHAEHDDRRHPWSGHRGHAIGFVLTAPGHSVWFAGDTGLFDGMAALPRVDTALIPVGGWGPTLGPHHLDPDQAADATIRVGARHAIPIHYGTFWPIGLRALAPSLYRAKCRAPGARFRSALAGRPVEVHLPGPGDTVALRGVTR